MSWQGCRNILCIRPDNMGDLIMSGPAIRALKQTFKAKITVLTSTMGAVIAPFISEIDEVMVCDLPWVKSAKPPDSDEFNQVVETIRKQNFDAAVIFTVFSQNPLPTATMAYLAGIPKVLAYCRENPYHLINNWVPDTEPYDQIKHQVTRDLDLVASVGAVTNDQVLKLTGQDHLWPVVSAKLTSNGVDTGKPWIILHPGVSEKKRQYPAELWVEAAKQFVSDHSGQVVLTGTSSESDLTTAMQEEVGPGSFSLAGLFDIDEYICLVKNARLMLSVNTGTTHIAAAVGTPVVVLYAETNPQHTPWMVPSKVLTFPVPDELKSKNQVVAFLGRTIYQLPSAMPQPQQIVDAAIELLNSPASPAQSFHGTQRQNQAK